MSLGKQYTVWCDVVRDDAEQRSPEDCETWIGNEDSGKEARRLARRAGWKHVTGANHWNSRDYCPPCAKARGLK